MNTREPQPRQDTPRCPSWLNSKAKRVWKRLVPELQAMGVLTAADGEALASLCQAYSRWREAEEFLDKHGLVYPLRDEKGNIRCMQQFPQVAIARNMQMVVKAYLQEFGMTPASRSRIELPLATVVRPTTSQDSVPVLSRLGNPL